MKNIVLIAGTKGVGKSTLAQQLRDHIRLEYEETAAVLAFADGLKEMAVKILTQLGVDSIDIERILFSPDKEEPFFKNGASGREFIIDMSQNFIKKYFGQDVWGDYTLFNIGGMYTDWLILEDLRFNDEFHVLKKVYGDNVVVVHLDGPTIYECEKDFKVSPEHFDCRIHSDGENFFYDEPYMDMEPVEQLKWAIDTVIELRDNIRIDKKTGE